MSLYEPNFGCSGENCKKRARVFLPISPHQPPLAWCTSKECSPDKIYERADKEAIEWRKKHGN